MTPTDPESLPPAPDDGAAPARPDWLVGAEEGVDAELSSKRAETPKPALRLIKPGGEGTVASGDGAKPPATPRPPASGADEMTLDGPGHSAPPASDSGGSREIELASDPAGGSGSGTASAGGGEALRISDLVARRGARSGEKAAPEKKTAWTAAASSVPKLRLVESKPAARPAPAPAPADDEEESAQAGAFPDDLPAPGAFPVSASPAAAAVAARPKSVAPSESWWLIALDRLRYERRLQLLLGVMVVAVIVLMVVQSGGGGGGGTSISQIHSHPEKYDGRSVTVQGRVGEVFSVGGGYAFYLHQGRDTLVVFTRSRLPVSRQKVSVKGSISTGFLDGEPRQSLFEDS